MQREFILECDICEGVVDLTIPASHSDWEIQFCPCCGSEIVESDEIEELEDPEEIDE